MSITQEEYESAMESDSVYESNTDSDGGLSVGGSSEGEIKPYSEVTIISPAMTDDDLKFELSDLGWHRPVRCYVENDAISEVYITVVTRFAGEADMLILSGRKVQSIFYGYETSEDTYGVALIVRDSSSRRLLKERIEVPGYRFIIKRYSTLSDYGRSFTFKHEKIIYYRGYYYSTEESLEKLALREVSFNQPMVTAGRTGAQIHEEMKWLSGAKELRRCVIVSSRTLYKLLVNALSMPVSFETLEARETLKYYSTESEGESLDTLEIVYPDGTRDRVKVDSHGLLALADSLLEQRISNYFKFDILRFGDRINRFDNSVLYLLHIGDMYVINYNGEVMIRISGDSGSLKPYEDLMSYSCGELY